MIDLSGKLNSWSSKMIWLHPTVPRNMGWIEKSKLAKSMSAHSSLCLRCNFFTVQDSWARNQHPLTLSAKESWKWILELEIKKTKMLSFKEKHVISDLTLFLPFSKLPLCCSIRHKATHSFRPRRPRVMSSVSLFSSLQNDSCILSHCNRITFNFSISKSKHVFFFCELNVNLEIPQK